MPEIITFYLFAALTVVASALVIGQRNPMYSVMLLIVSFGALSGLYVLLDAPFTAVTQIIIYAGAIMVLFLFVVMLLNAQREERLIRGVPAIGATGKTLLIDVKPQDAFALSARNIAGVRLVASGRVTARDVMDTSRVIATREALEKLQESLG